MQQMAWAVDGKGGRKYLRLWRRQVAALERIAAVLEEMQAAHESEEAEEAAQAKEAPRSLSEEMSRAFLVGLLKAMQVQADRFGVRSLDKTGAGSTEAQPSAQAEEA